MSFDAISGVTGSPSAQPIMEGGVIPPSTPAPAPAPSAEPKAASAPAPAAPASDAAPATPPAWEPVHKFKVMDKEHEIPEFLRAAIKDEVTNKQLIELHEKALGLDVVKPRLKEVQEKYKATQAELSQFTTTVDELRGHVAKGDFGAFFERLSIPKEKVLQWMIDEAKYSELPPEQKAVLDARKAAEARAELLEKQNQGYQSQLQETVANAKRASLQIELAKPDVSSIAQAFDSRPGGKPGDFMNEVINRGELAWATQGKDITPEQAVQEAIAIFGAGYGAKPASPPAPVVVPPAQAKPAAIPNIAGRSASPTAKTKKPGSIADLKKLALGQTL